MFGIACLFIYVIAALAGGGRPNYVNSSSAKNFRKTRNQSMKNVSGLKSVKSIKASCFK